MDAVLCQDQALAEAVGNKHLADRALVMCDTRTVSRRFRTVTHLSIQVAPPPQ